jgi:hypothetical protein
MEMKQLLEVTVYIGSTSNTMNVLLGISQIIVIQPKRDTSGKAVIIMSNGFEYETVDQYSAIANSIRA